MLTRIVLIIVFIVFLFPPKAFACSCGQSEFESFFKSARNVVTVRVIDHIGEDKVLVHFDDVWKGLAPKKKEAEVLAGLNSSCGYTKKLQPEIGTKYLIYSGGIYEELPFRIRVNACNRNALYENRLDDVEKLREYKAKLESLSQKVSLSSENAALLLTKAKFLYDYRDFVNAESTLQKLLNIEPSNLEGILLMSEILYQNGKSQHELGWKDEIYIRKSLKGDAYEKALGFADRALELSKNNQRAMSVKIASSLQLGEKINHNLSNLNLTNTKIEYQHFSDIKFENVDFGNTTFFGNNIENIIIENSSFEGGKIRLTKLNGVHAKNTNFDDTYIDKAARKWAKQDIPFEETHFINSTFENSSFIKARVILPIINSEIKNCDFNQASFEAGYGEGELVVMNNVNVIDSDFSGASVRHNSFKLGTIKNSKFENVNFDGASVKAELINVDFSKANIKQASFLGSMFDCKTKWPEGVDPIKLGASPIEKQCSGKPFAFHDFSEKEFKKFEGFGPVNFAGASFKNAKMYGASFVGANLSNSDFTGADLRSADLRKTNMAGANLEGLKIQRINFEEANLKGANFTGAYFERAILRKADISGVNFTGAKLVATSFEGAIYDQNTIWPEGFDFSNLGLIKAK